MKKLLMILAVFFGLTSFANAQVRHPMHHRVVHHRRHHHVVHHAVHHRAPHR